MRTLPLIAFVAAGCTGLSGLSDLTFHGEGQGGTQSAGGAGVGAGGRTSVSVSSVSSSSSGGAPGVLPADWSRSLTGVYDFEDENDLGAGTPGPPLVPTGDLVLSEGMVGSAAVELVPGSGFSSASPELQLGEDDHLTLTAWVRVSESSGQAVEVVSRYSGSEGISMDVVGDTVECFLGRGLNSGFGSASSATGTVTRGVWAHIACTFNVEEGLVTAFVDGNAYDVVQVETPSIAAPGDLAISSEGFPLTGGLDELTIHRGLLSESAIARIYACNVDGALCRCDPADLDAYVECGRFDNCPPILPPCRQPTP